VCGYLQVAAAEVLVQDKSHRQGVAKELRTAAEAENVALKEECKRRNESKVHIMRKYHRTVNKFRVRHIGPSFSAR